MRKLIGKCGMAGLVFFTVKGLVWLLLGAAAAGGAAGVMR